MASSTLPERAPPDRQSVAADLALEDFAAQLRRALTDLARRSAGRRVDLAAALKGAGLAIDAPRIREALLLLQAAGFVQNPVALPDACLLLTVSLVAMVQAAWVARFASSERAGPVQ